MLTAPRNETASGSVEVIYGCMFSGKTGELIRRLSDARAAGSTVEVAKPATDVRYSATEIVSHDGVRMPCSVVRSSEELLRFAGETAVMGIDEAQFFDPALPAVAVQLAAVGARVIIAGLDTDFRGQPFGPMPALLSLATDVTRLHAICAKCSGPAFYSYRTGSSTKTILIGERETYEPRCERCFFERAGF